MSSYSHQQSIWIPCSPHLLQHFFFFLLAILTCMSRNLIVLFICISLMVIGHEHLFKCLLGISFFFFNFGFHSGTCWVTHILFSQPGVIENDIRDEGEKEMWHLPGRVYRTHSSVCSLWEEVTVEEVNARVAGGSSLNLNMTLPFLIFTWVNKLPCLLLLALLVNRGSFYF